MHDNGLVQPGVLTRQLFTEKDIGKRKVAAVAARLKEIRPEIEIEARVGDLLSGPLAHGDWTDGSDVVIDTTGSGPVMTKIEATRRDKANATPFVSMALGHTAERAVVSVAAADYSGGPLDIDRKLGLECSRRSDLDESADEFWPREARATVFQPEPGCSDATFVGSCTDVSLLAAAMLNLAARDLGAPGAPATGHLLAQPGAQPSGSLAHKTFGWPPDRVLNDPVSGYEIRMSSAAWHEIAGWISNNGRTRGTAIETGGLLFGECNGLLKVLWVDEVSGPPPDSSHSAGGFICGVQGSHDLACEKAKRTQGLVRFVGIWHTHPTGPTLPSEADLQAMEQLVQSSSGLRGKTLMLIVGNDDGSGRRAAAYCLGAEDIARIRSVGRTRLSLTCVS